MSKPATLINTSLGEVYVLFNDDRRAYVRAGERIDGAQTVDDLKLSRGATVRVSSHFIREEDGPWRPHRGFTHISRTDSQRDATAAMNKQAHDAITDALNEFTQSEGGQDTLALAARADRAADVASRTETIADLEKVIAHLRAEIEAIEDGGRTAWFENRYRSGYSDKTVNVVKVDGTIMDACPELPRISGTGRYNDARERVEEK